MRAASQRRPDGLAAGGRAAMVGGLAAVLLVGCGGEDTVAEGPLPPYAVFGEASGAGASGRGLRFTEVSAAVGIDFVHETGAFGQKWMPETMGSGGGFLDYDGDGWPDIFLVNGSRWAGHEGGGARATSALYRNAGDGTFEDVTAAAGLDISLYGMGAAVADFDADGDPDIYLTAVGENRLLRNDAGRFEDVTRAAGVSGNTPGGPAPAWSTGAVWVDVDRDGWLDLFVCNYVQWTPETDLFTTLDGETKSYATPEQYHGESCRLYRNLDGRRFADVTGAAGVENPQGKSLGIAVEDLNDDGWPDLVVANDTYANFLYLNDGDGTFTDVAVRAGVGYDEFGRARAGMGVDVAAVGEDGSLAVVIGNFSREPLSLYTQIGDGLFQDRAGVARLSRPSLLPLTFGVAFADLDLDGYLDLVAANGHIEPTINQVQQDVMFAQPLQVFVNTGDGRFAEGGDDLGEAFRKPIVGRGVATADVDRDGDLDVLVTVNGGRPLLLRNDVPAADARWIRLVLRGDAPNPDALGALVTVFADGRVLRRMVRTGSSYLTQSETNPLLVGVGGAAGADSIAVRWPTTGRVDRLPAAKAGQTYEIVEADPGTLTARP